MEVTLLDWPESTPLLAHHRIVQRYIQDLSTKTGVHLATKYGTRVQQVRKVGSEWEITWMTLRKKSMQTEHSAVSVAAASD